MADYMDLDSRLQHLAELYNEAMEAARRENKTVKIQRKGGLITLVSVVDPVEGEYCIWTNHQEPL